MQKPKGPNAIGFAGPATYSIVVQGSLSDDWSDRLAGLVIERVERNDEPTRTILAGPIRDQAELAGVLETLYGLHLPILQVQHIDSPVQGRAEPTH